MFSLETMLGFVTTTALSTMPSTVLTTGMVAAQVPGMRRRSAADEICMMAMYVLVLITRLKMGREEEELTQLEVAAAAALCM